MAVPKHSLQIFLPLEYNPDKQGHRRPVEPEKFMRVENEILSHFSEFGYSWEFLERKRTFGKYKGQIDVNKVIIIDVYLQETDFEWIAERQKAWASKEYFDQEAIYIRSHEILVW